MSTLLKQLLLALPQILLPTTRWEAKATWNAILTNWVLEPITESSWEGLTLRFCLLSLSKKNIPLFLPCLIIAFSERRVCVFNVMKIPRNPKPFLFSSCTNLLRRWWRLSWHQEQTRFQSEWLLGGRHVVQINLIFHGVEEKFFWATVEKRGKH